VDGDAADFNSMGMTTDRGGAYYAEIPEQPNKSVIEFFFIVSSNENESKQWPPLVPDRGNVCNYLYMVDDDSSSSRSASVMTT
jgi:hypothetical protein